MKCLKRYIDTITGTPNIDTELYSHEEDKLTKKAMGILKHDQDKKPERILIDRVLKQHQEALYNLQYFNPYLKKEAADQYADLKRWYRELSDEEKDECLHLVTNYIIELKSQILGENDDKVAKKIMPLMHIVMFFITYYHSRGK